MNVRAMHQAGASIRSIARETGLSRNTVRKLVRSSSAPIAASRSRDSKLDAFKDYVGKRWSDLNCVRLHEEIAAMGYTGSVSTLRRYVAKLRTTQQHRSDLTVRFETPPGKQAQMDWG